MSGASAEDDQAQRTPYHRSNTRGSHQAIAFSRVALEVPEVPKSLVPHTTVVAMTAAQWETTLENGEMCTQTM